MPETWKPGLCGSRTFSLCWNISYSTSRCFRSVPWGQQPLMSPNHGNVCSLAKMFLNMTKQFAFKSLKTKSITVNSINFVVTKFHYLQTLGMFVDTWIRGFQIICNITRLKKCFIGILNLWIALPTKYMKLNAPRLLMISQSFIKWIVTR